MNHRRPYFLLRNGCASVLKTTSSYTSVSGGNKQRSSIIWRIVVTESDWGKQRSRAATVSVMVARQNGIAPNQLFTWGRLEGALTATGAEEEVVPASDYRALQNQVRELQRLLGKKTLEAEILKEALEVAAGPKKDLMGPWLPDW